MSTLSNVKTRRGELFPPCARLVPGAIPVALFRKGVSVEYALIRNIIFFLLFFMGCPIQASAQDNPWVIGVYTRSNSFFTNNVMSLGGAVINYLISDAMDGVTTYDLLAYNYHYVDMKDDHGDIDVKRNKYYGLTAYDLFNDFEAGLKFGWHKQTSPIGAYVYGTYGMNQYKIRFAGDSDYNRHQLQNLRIGAGLEIIPLASNLEDAGLSPVIELKTAYIKNFKYSGPNGNDMDQINNGFRSSIAAGVTYGENGIYSILLFMDFAHYDIFNSRYTPDGGITHPYSGFKSKDMNFGLRVSCKLFGE